MNNSLSYLIPPITFPCLSESVINPLRSMVVLSLMLDTCDAFLQASSRKTGYGHSLSPFLFCNVRLDQHKVQRCTFI